LDAFDCVALKDRYSRRAHRPDLPARSPYAELTREILSDCTFSIFKERSSVDSYAVLAYDIGPLVDLPLQITGVLAGREHLHLDRLFRQLLDELAVRGHALELALQALGNIGRRS